MPWPPESIPEPMPSPGDGGGSRIRARRSRGERSLRRGPASRHRSRGVRTRDDDPRECRPRRRPRYRARRLFKVWWTPASCHRRGEQRPRCCVGPRVLGPLYGRPRAMARTDGQGGPPRTAPRQHRARPRWRCPCPSHDRRTGPAQTRAARSGRRPPRRRPRARTLRLRFGTIATPVGVQSATEERGPPDHSSPFADWTPTGGARWKGHRAPPGLNSPRRPVPPQPKALVDASFRGGFRLRAAGRAAPRNLPGPHVAG